MPMANDFDKAFGPLYSTVIGGYHVKLMDYGLARVNGRTVTDYDCFFCGDVGRHTGDFCPHQEAMRQAEQEWKLEEDAAQMLDHADQQAESYAVMAGVG